MQRIVLVLLAAIALLTGGSTFLIYLVTRPPDSAAPGVARRDPRRDPQAQPDLVQADPAPPVRAPVVITAPFAPPRSADPGPPPVMVDASPPPLEPTPVPNQSRVVEGPPPEGVPADEEARAAALLDVRRRRFSDQMDRLNRRGAQLQPNAAPGTAPAVAPQRGGYTRRGGLAAPPPGASK